MTRINLNQEQIEAELAEVAESMLPKLTTEMELTLWEMLMTQMQVSFAAMRATHNKIATDNGDDVPPGLYEALKKTAREAGAFAVLAEREMKRCQAELDRKAAAANDGE